MGLNEGAVTLKGLVQVFFGLSLFTFNCLSIYEPTTGLEVMVTFSNTYNHKKCHHDLQESKGTSKESP